MKVPRYLLSLCAIFLLMAVAVSAAAVETEEAEETDDQLAERNPLLLRAAVAIIRQAVKWAAKHCAEEAAHNCKQHWKHPKALVSCAKRFLQGNKGRCVSG